MRRSRDIARSKHSEADAVAETESSDAEPGDVDPNELEAAARSSGLSAWQFRIAVIRHHRLVHHVAHALLRDAAEAEDVTQEAFLKLWQQGGAVRRQREWLLKVARRLCLDRLRVAHRMRTVGSAGLDAASLDAAALDSDGLDSWPLGSGARGGAALDSDAFDASALDPAARGPGARSSAAFATAREERGPSWHLQQRELAERLRVSIAALPEPQRTLVVLFDVHGLDGAACARILGISTNQVKVYLHRARRRMRRELESSE
jgi:RNA polymerase sigma factor (sigma-70 family)